MRAALTSATSELATELAQDKDATKRMLEGVGLPTPGGAVVRDLDAALEVADTLRYPVLLKPVDGNHGRGVSGRLDDAAALRVAPESRPFARVLDLRSPGVQDLRLGLDLPLRDGVRYHAVCATLPRGGWLVGDGLVRRASATRGFDDAQHVFASHFSVLRDPAVHAEVQRRTASTSASEASAAAAITGGRRSSRPTGGVPAGA